MSLTKQIAKYIHPVLREFGFSKVDHYWRRQDEKFFFVVYLRSSNHGTGQQVLEIDLGAFSTEIEELYGQRLKLGIAMDQMPGGLPLCHFHLSLFQVEEDLTGWTPKRARVLFLPGSTDVSQDFEVISLKLREVLPKFMRDYSSIEKIVTSKEQGIGFAAKSSLSKLQAACGCVVLGRYDQAEAFIGEAIKAGSGPFEREIADRLHLEIEKRKPQNG